MTFHIHGTERRRAMKKEEALILFKDEQRRPIQHEFVTETKTTKTSLIARDNQFIVIVEIMDDEGNSAARFEVMTGSMLEPILAFRLYRILAELPKLSVELTHLAALILINGTMNVEVLGIEESKDHFFKTLDQSSFESIMKELPPNLEGMIADLRAVGLHVDTAGLQREVEVGTLEMSSFLLQMGVDHRPKLDERLAPLRERAELLRPALNSIWRGWQTSESCMEEMLETVVGCYRRGIEEDEHAVGLAALLHVDRKLRTFLAIDKISKMLGLPAVFSTHPEDLVQEISRKVSTLYDGDPKELADVLRRYRDEWSAMKIVV